MFARNGNILSFGLVAALVSGFSSCTEAPVDTQQLVNHQVHDEYVANFVAKYGQPSPNQTWDFSNRPTADDPDILPCPEEASTRAISSAAELTGEEWVDSPDIKISLLAPVQTFNERLYIANNLANVKEKEWGPNYYETIDLWVWYCHGNGLDDVTYSLGICCLEPGTGSHNAGTLYNTSLPIMGHATSTNWHSGSGYYMGNGYRIDASALNSDAYQNVYWYAYAERNEYDEETGEPVSFPITTTTGDEEYKAAFELKYYKEIETPYGAIYWCFDCDHDGDYSDLVCLVEPTSVKRYLIEDLGALDDFDFNDIVVDVVSNKDGQKATVRAMGGTLDFTLTIGKTSWSKSGNGFDIATPYNADGDMGYTATLAEFDVQDWEPSANNISVTVKKKQTTETGSDVILSFPFPKAGEVPMIIAVTPTTTFNTGEASPRPWMPERVSIPARLFTEESTTEP